MKWFLQIMTTEGSYILPKYGNGYKTKKEAENYAQKLREKPGILWVVLFRED